MSVRSESDEQVFTITGETCGFDPMRGSIACIGTGDTCDLFSPCCGGRVREPCAGGELARRDGSPPSP